jgi:hypothetical protein
MTVYGRTYTPPVFHTEQASKAQLKVMQIVFDTLQNSGIDFCVVQQSTTSSKKLVIKSYGNFSLNEKGEILQEVVEMYINGNAINHIYME